MEIRTNEKGYDNIKLNELEIGESFSFEVSRDPLFGTGKYGDYVMVNGELPDGKTFTFFVPAYMNSDAGKLIDKAKKFKEGDKVTITRKLQKMSGKNKSGKDSYSTYEVVIGEEKKKATLGLKLSAPKPAFSEEELDFIKQVKESINTIDEDVLIASIIDSFQSVGKEISQEKAELIYAEAKK